MPARGSKRAAPPIQAALVLSLIHIYPGVIGIHDLTVHNYGVGRCFASVHCEVPAEEDILISHDIIDNIERDFLKDMGIHLDVYKRQVRTSPWQESCRSWASHRKTARWEPGSS